MAEEYKAEGRDLEKVLGGLRFALVCVVLGMVYLNMRLCHGIETFREIAADWLDGRALPWSTGLVLGWKVLFLLANYGLGAVTFACFFLPVRARTFYVLGVLALLQIGQIALVYAATFGSLFQLFTDQLGTA